MNSEVQEMLPLSTELASRTLIQKLPETTKKEPAQSDAIKPAAEESNPAVSGHRVGDHFRCGDESGSG